MRVFNDDSQFNDASFALVARFVFEDAVKVISDGNIADQSEDTLNYLLILARNACLSKDVINSLAFYHNSVFEENDQMRIDFGKC